MIIHSVYQKGVLLFISKLLKTIIHVCGYLPMATSIRKLSTYCSMIGRSTPQTQLILSDVESVRMLQVTPPPDSTCF